MHLSRWRIALLATLVSTLIMGSLGVVQARWRVIAEHAVDPIRVCTDGIIFDHTADNFDESTDYSGFPRVEANTFKAASPPPPSSDYPAPGTIIAEHTFATYKFQGEPWGIDVSDPPDGVDDLSWVYRGISATRWSRSLNPGDEVRLTFADFGSSEVETVEVVEACTAFAIDIKPGSPFNLVERRSKATVEVAILRGPGVNPLHIISSTVRFGPTGTEAKPIGSRYADVDRDGDIDRVFKFNAATLRFGCESRVGILQAQTTIGEFIGADVVRPSGCSWPGW